MQQRILVLGAGFGGMELCALLSESIAGEAEITLIDRSESVLRSATRSWT